MKIRIDVYFLCLLLICSCEKSDLDFENDYESSFKAWESFKKTSGNTYSYTVTNASWTGTSWETKVTIRNGKAVKREFELIKAENVPTDELKWVENENQLNTHTNTAATPAITLDDIYEKAKKDWLLKRKNVKTFFEAKNAGLISTCGYVEDGCMDDCFRGITISQITPQK